MNTKTATQSESVKLTDHYLVGIGASAGGLEAIHQLFDHFPSNSSFSFIIIQHLSPDHKSLMAELLSKHTQMQVQEAEDNMLTKPNHVYVLPSGKQLTIQRGRLKLTDKSRNREPNFAIDFFFESLAKDQGKYAIGVILSGTGTDGTKGAKAIKEAGGMVVVQDPASAKFDGMPNSAIDSGCVDFVLSPKRIPQEIIDYTKNIPLVKSVAGADSQDQEDSILQEILGLVCTQTAIDFKDYKQPTIKRRIAKRMEHLNIRGLYNYLTYMQGNPAEIKQLCQEFFIGVTKFFRDPEAYEYLENEIIPKIISEKAPGEPVKVWVAACSTGEEAYSLAMLFNECFSRLNREPLIKLFATDIDSRAINRASKGSYPISIAKDVSPERLSRFFYRQGNRYIITEEIRKMVVFAQHDIQKDPPFSRLDLISCRNMLIYMNSALQKKVLAAFPYSINLNGYLLLGPSEYTGDLKPFFSEENRRWKVFRKVKDSSPAQRSFGNSGFGPALASSVPSPRNSQLAEYTDSFINAVTEELGLTGIYVDENYQLLHGIGDINRFLRFTGNRLHFNLLKMVPDELAVALSVGIRKALKQNHKIETKRIEVKEGKKIRLIHVSITPLTSTNHLQKVLLILFYEEKKTKAALKSIGSPASLGSDYYEQLSSLESELKETRENLHLAIQDLSASNEELQSSNEELLSANEELQSSNEEMQSLNEELHTVNSEHQLKIKELQELNEDLDNYFRSSNIGQLFVDHNLVIRKFTPAVNQQINIIDSDIGRPIHHLSHNLKYPQLIDDIRTVNNTSTEIEQEVETQDGKFYLMRIIPYLKQDKNKDGVIISFVDVTALKALNTIVHGVLNSSLNSIMAFKAIRSSEHILTDFEWKLLNRRAEELIGKPSDKLIGTNVATEMAFLKKSGLFKKFAGVVESGKPLHIEQYLEIGNKKAWYEIAAVKMEDGLTVTMADITEKKNAEDKALSAYEDLKKAEENLIKLNNELEERVAERTKELSVSEERFRLVSLATNDVIWDWNLVSNELWWNEGIKTILGYQSEEVKQGVNWWFDKIHPDDRDRVIKGINKAINFGRKQWTDEFQILKADGSYAYVSNRAYILHNEYQIPYRMLGSFIDLSDLKTTQEQLTRTNEHLLRINADLDNFVYTASHDLKAPIANIEGLIVMLERKLGIFNDTGKFGEQVQEVFQLIRQSIDRFKTTVKDLAEITKVQKNLDGELSQVNLYDVMDEVQSNIRDAIEQAHAQIEVDFSAASKIQFSKKNLYSIVYNLVSNAIKYRSSDRRPKVTLKTELVDDYILLTVKDNGLGMREENLAKIFTMFKRFHTHVDGTGIGLYIVKRIMDNAGGNIEIESKEGEGTIFKVFFRKKQ